MTTPHSIQELCGRTIHSIQGDFETPTVTFYDRNRVPLFSVDIRELWAPDGNRWIERINNAVNFTADKPQSPPIVLRTRPKPTTDHHPDWKPLKYSTSTEMYKVFRNGVGFRLHYYDRTYRVTNMVPRGNYVYVMPPSLPVKIKLDGSSGEGSNFHNIWLEEIHDDKPQAMYHDADRPGNVWQASTAYKSGDQVRYDPPPIKPQASEPYKVFAFIWITAIIIGAAAYWIHR